MCILLPSQTSERTRHSARPHAKCGFSSIQQVSYFPPRKSGQFPCSAVTLCVQFFGLAIWLLYLFFSFMVLYLLTDLPKSNGVSCLLHRLQHHPVHWGIVVAAQGVALRLMTVWPSTAPCVRHQEPLTTEENRAPANYLQEIPVNHFRVCDTVPDNFHSSKT